MEFTKVSGQSGGIYAVKIGDTFSTVGSRGKSVLEFLEQNPGKPFGPTQMASGHFKGTVSSSDMIRVFTNLARKFRDNITYTHGFIVYTP